MARAPFQVLVIPYRRSGVNLEYLVLHRADADIWQGVAGGGEGDECVLEAAQREFREELGCAGSDWIALDATASIPRTLFSSHASWHDHPYVIPEHSFGACIADEPVFSHEHDDHRWMRYDEARARLTFDSNRTALWELNERLLAS